MAGSASSFLTVFLFGRTGPSLTTGFTHTPQGEESVCTLSRLRPRVGEPDNFHPSRGGLLHRAQPSSAVVGVCSQRKSRSNSDCSPSPRAAQACERLVPGGGGPAMTVPSPPQRLVLRRRDFPRRRLLYKRQQHADGGWNNHAETRRRPAPVAVLSDLLAPRFYRAIWKS